MKLLFLLSKENIALSKAEIERLHGKKGLLRGEYVLLESDSYHEQLAFTREVHEVLFEGLKTAEAFPWHEHVEPPFAVEANALLDEALFAGYIWRSLAAAGVEPSVDLKGPLTTISLFGVEGTVLVTKRLWKNNEHFFDRRPHLRPRNHPTGLNPKLARAMINLAGEVKEILDPFCGAGGILLEGALAGRKMTGLDIDQEQIARAEENLAYYKAAATLSVGDATKCDVLGQFDAIVTDLPLGKNAILKEATKTFTDFFAAASKTAKIMIVAIDVAFNIEQCFGLWKEKARFDWFIHKGMTKRIFLLER